MKFKPIKERQEIRNTSVDEMVPNMNINVFLIKLGNEKYNIWRNGGGYQFGIIRQRDNNFTW